MLGCVICVFWCVLVCVCELKCVHWVSAYVKRSGEAIRHNQMSVQISAQILKSVHRCSDEFVWVCLCVWVWVCVVGVCVCECLCVGVGVGGVGCCRVYTSDAADEEDSVDVGGSRVIEKKITRT